MVNPNKRRDVNITLDPIGVGTAATPIGETSNLDFKSKVALKYPKGFRKRRK